MEKEIFIVIMLFSLILSKPNKEPENNEQIIANIYYDKTNKNFTINVSETKDNNSIAYAIYNKSYERTGWDFLSISTYDKNDNKYEDSQKAYAMGYLEGYLTKDRISSYFTKITNYLFYRIDSNVKDELIQFLKENIEYMKKNSESKKNKDKYWEYVYYIYQQLEGLYNGYKSTLEDINNLDFYDFLILPATGDAMEYLGYLNQKKETNFEKMNVDEIKRFFLLNSHVLP